MIDFEGKMMPYVQTSEIMLRLISEGLVLGDGVLVTPQIPSVSQETVLRQLMALMSLMGPIIAYTILLWSHIP